MSAAQDEEEVQKANFLNHAINYAFPPGSLSPSSTKLKRAMPGHIAKLKAIVACHEWLQKQKELMQVDPDKVEWENMTMLSAFNRFVDIWTKQYCDFIVSEDGWRTNVLTAWVTSQKSNRSMTIKKPGIIAKLTGRANEVQYVPDPEA